MSRPDPISSESPPPFAVIAGDQVARVLRGREEEVVQIIQDAYRLHGAGATVNPPSFFLRFPDDPSARIIGLPASVGGAVDTTGLKWIASYPQNVARGLPRASAVLILNDRRTGYPYACLEASIISAARTAASATLAARVLRARTGDPARIGYIGAGLIARYIHTYLVGTGWVFDEVAVHDRDPASAAVFGTHVRLTGKPATVHPNAEDVIAGSDLVVFATTAGEPHIGDPAVFAHAPLVLHLSLRDLAPQVILEAVNVVDDVDHCLRANTSLHLTEQRVGHRDFVHGTLPEVLAGTVAVPAGRTVIFSPFGLGTLDVALAAHVHAWVRAAAGAVLIPHFFHELDRHRAAG